MTYAAATHDRDDRDDFALPETHMLRMVEGHIETLVNEFGLEAQVRAMLARVVPPTESELNQHPQAAAPVAGAGMADDFAAAIVAAYAAAGDVSIASEIDLAIVLANADRALDRIINRQKLDAEKSSLESAARLIKILLRIVARKVAR